MANEATKLELIEWLTHLDDEDTINYLKVIKDSNSQQNDWWSDLTEEQIQGIERGLKDIDKGRVIPHYQVQKMYGL